MKKALIVLVLLTCMTALCFSQTTFAVRNTASWIEAVNGIRNGGNDKEYTIIITGTVSVPATPSDENTFGTVTDVTINIEGSGTLSKSNNGRLLQIGTAQTIVAKNFTLNDFVYIMGGTFHMEGKASATGIDVDNKGTFAMKDNTSVTGRVYSMFITDGTFTMSGGTISGGVFVRRNGIFIMEGGTISGNTFSSDSSLSSAYGGGVNVNGGTFTMSGGTISGNTASSSSPPPSGGGVYNSGTFTMKDSASVSGNTSTYYGGGVYVGQNGTFTMSDNTSVSGNKAPYGGGVYVQGGNFTMQDNASVSDNKTTYYGGGVYVDQYGTFTMQDSTSVSGNTATYYGGGVYIEGRTYGNEGGTFAKPGGTVYGDDAEQKLKNTVISRLGHAVYGNGWRNATAGPTMNTDSYGFWLNDGDVVIFPSGFEGIWKRSNFNNTLMVTKNAVNSSSRDFVWILQRISGDRYTLKRTDASNTMTLTIKLDGRNLIISGDSGNGENNWNGTWSKR